MRRDAVCLYRYTYVSKPIVDDLIIYGEINTKVQLHSLTFLHQLKYT